MFITSIITTKIPRKQQPYNKNINQYNTHEITKRNNLILMMQMPTKFVTSTDYSTVDMAEPNLSSSSNPCAIFQELMWDLIKLINKN